MLLRVGWRKITANAGAHLLPKVGTTQERTL
jgi:hypothetical protein